ncbi:MULTISPECIES: hypothetical protein [unclassified Caballeronia]|nr:hypothetical protein [Caballeronia sp. LZ008]
MKMALHRAGPFFLGARIDDSSIVRPPEHMSSPAGRLSARLESIEFQSWDREPMMKDLIAKQLYQPAVVLPLLLLTRLMVTLDFNLAQVMFVMVLRGSQHAYQFALRHAVSRQRNGASVKHLPCNNCC